MFIRIQRMSTGGQLDIDHLDHKSQLPHCSSHQKTTPQKSSPVSSNTRQPKKRAMQVEFRAYSHYFALTRLYSMPLVMGLSSNQRQPMAPANGQNQGVPQRHSHRQSLGGFERHAFSTQSRRANRAGAMRRFSSETHRKRFILPHYTSMNKIYSTKLAGDFMSMCGRNMKKTTLEQQHMDQHTG